MQEMKQGIHPDYKLAEVHCACGEKYQTRSTKDSIRLDICSHCHPFFTGKQKLIDTEGRVDKFRKKYNKA
jgi:large subunit ribosomal protein L31